MTVAMAAEALRYYAALLHDDTEHLVETNPRIAATCDRLLELAVYLEQDNLPDRPQLCGRFTVQKSTLAALDIHPYAELYDLYTRDNKWGRGTEEGAMVARGLTYAEVDEISEYWPHQVTSSTPKIYVDYAPAHRLSFEETKGAPILRFDVTKVPVRIGNCVISQSRGWDLHLPDEEWRMLDVPGDDAVVHIGGHMTDVDCAVAAALDFLHAGIDPAARLPVSPYMVALMIGSSANSTTEFEGVVREVK
jgi:hypothetical protein